MPERTTVAQKVQIGVETTPGTAVPANKLLPGLSIVGEPQSVMQKFRPQGFKYQTIVVQQKEWMQAALSGYPTFDEIVYVLSGVISRSVPAPTQQTDGTGGQVTGAYKWVFDSATDTEDNPNTFTVETGSSVRAYKFANSLVKTFGFKFNRDAVDVSGQMIGQLMTDGVTLTGSPTSLPLVPMLATGFDFFIDPTSGALGTTKLGRFFEGEFQLNDRYGPFWTVDSSQASYAGVVEIAPTATMSVMVEADATGMSYLNTLRAGTTVFARIRCLGPNVYTASTKTVTTNSTTALSGVTPVFTAADVGKKVVGTGIPAGATLTAQAGATGTLSAAATASATITATIGTSIPYSFTVDMAMKVGDALKYEDHDGIYAARFPFDIVNDATWGHPFHAEVVNGTAAL